ncbi:hypothetical protein [Nocardia sp. SSK8]|uniref:hypothetical protein n=1 Tax=Nocardia sp. SSK8 TaxID=3120154 RepID=UPI00300ADFA5
MFRQLTTSSEGEVCGGQDLSRDEDDLFSQVGVSEENVEFCRRLTAFVAPVARHRGAVVEDPAVLAWAQAVYAAFGDRDDSGRGLTAAELEAMCGDAGPGTFESRFSVLRGMGFVHPPRDQPHQQRLVFPTVSVAALLVFERLKRGGGVQEILILLDETRQGVVDDQLQSGEISSKLITLRRAIAISANELIQLAGRPVEELIAQRANHRMSEQLLQEARTLIDLVSEQFPELAATGGQLIAQALRYSAAANVLVERLLEHIKTHRDFSMLTAEQYRSAALRSSADVLAGVFTQTVFDPPSTTVTAQRVIATMRELRPREIVRRPPRTVAYSDPGDPVERARRRQQAVRIRRETMTRLYLRGREKADLTDELLKAGWPRAARIVADLLAATADCDLPVRVVLGVSLRVDSAAAVSYMTPLRLVVPADGHQHG